MLYAVAYDVRRCSEAEATVVAPAMDLSVGGRGRDLSGVLAAALPQPRSGPVARAGGADPGCRALLDARSACALRQRRTQRRGAADLALVPAAAPGRAPADRARVRLRRRASG